MVKVLDSRGMQILMQKAKARIKGVRYKRPRSTPGGSIPVSVNGKRLNERGVKVLIAKMLSTIDGTPYVRPS